MKGISLIHWLIERDKKIIFSDNDFNSFLSDEFLNIFNCAHEMKIYIVLFQGILRDIYRRKCLSQEYGSSALLSSKLRIQVYFYFFSCKVFRCKFKEPSTKKRGMQDSQRYPFKPNNAKEDVVVFLNNCLILTVFSIVFEEIRKWLYEKPQLKIENNQYQEYMMDAIYSASGYSYESDMPLP